MKHCVFALVLASAVCLGQQAATPDRLPIKRVVLYKNGVGYFEHLGQVRENQEVSITFTSGQLNDVLKSLTVLDLNGGQITGVGYGSSAPLDRQLGDLRLPVGEKTSLTEFLEAVRGARIEAKSGGTNITGRLLSVEHSNRISAGASQPVDSISLITDAGEVRTLEISPALSVKLLDKSLSEKVARYLDLASASRDADVRRMVVSTTGSGERSVFLSYISEVPVWKATYRVVLDAKKPGNPLLQGWAIVDNTVGQDWDNVQLSLVAGAPQSFVQNLSQPYYARRPLVGMPDTGSSQPQTFESTLIPGATEIAGTVTDPTGAPVANATVVVIDAASGSTVGQVTTDASGAYRLAVPEGTMRLRATMQGFRTTEITGVTIKTGVPLRKDFTLSVGQTSEQVSISARGLAGSPPELPLNGRSFTHLTILGESVESARAKAQISSQANNLGDLFEYRIKQPITIERNRSSLVPILQSQIDAEKVSVWNERMTTSRPQRALWIKNSTGMTLDGGSFSVLEEETFAGEGIFEPIRPDEKRLVSYALDLAVNVGARGTSERQRVTRVKIINGVMTHETEVRENKIYTFRNEDSRERAMLVEHPARQGFELRSGIKPVETTADWMRFRVPVRAKQTETLVVEEVRPVESTYEISDISAEEVVLWGQQRSITPKIEAALKNVLAQKAAVDALEAKQESLEKESASIAKDQQRLRENMKALKGSVDEKALIQRYTAQLNQQENRLDAIKRETKALETQVDSAQEALNKVIQGLAFDEKI